MALQDGGVFEGSLVRTLCLLVTRNIINSCLLGNYISGVRQGYGICKFACGDVFEGYKPNRSDFTKSF